MGARNEVLEVPIFEKVQGMMLCVNGLSWEVQQQS